MEITLEQIAKALANGRISYRSAKRILTRQLESGQLNMTIDEAFTEIRKLGDVYTASLPKWKLELKGTTLIKGKI